MTIRQQRAAICDLMRSVPDIGVVHDYERYAADLSRLKALYFSPAHQDLRGWFVRRARVRETGILQPRFLEVTNWQIRGFMSLDDDAQSELAMDDLVEALRDAFRANPTLNGTVTKIGLLPPTSERGLQLEDSGPVLFGGVLCHGVKFALTTTTERSQ